jgi:hypothetical protein
MQSLNNMKPVVNNIVERLGVEKIQQAAYDITLQYPHSHVELRLCKHDLLIFTRLCEEYNKHIWKQRFLALYNTGNVYEEVISPVKEMSFSSYTLHIKELDLKEYACTYTTPQFYVCTDEKFPLPQAAFTFDDHLQVVPSAMPVFDKLTIAMAERFGLKGMQACRNISWV